MSIIDNQYVPQVNSAFRFSENKSFCQIATIDKTESESLPKLRTILLYHFQKRGVLYFTCSTQTKKWIELKTTPKVTGLYLDTESYTQYRFEADAFLVDNTVENEKDLYKSSWKSMRPDIRHVLWQEYHNDHNVNYDIEKIFPHHGIVILKPYYWDIFALGLEDFANSSRMQMVKRDGEWKCYYNCPRICPLDIKR